MIYSRSIRSFLTITIKLSLIAVLFFSGAYAFELLNSLHITKNVTADVHADAPINVWWPTDGSHVSDTQTFKAQLNDHDVSEYDMFWSVDGGQPNKMYDSSSDYPHKEAAVDVSGWNWNPAGSYKVTFSALDHTGNQLGSNSVTIYLPESSTGSTTIQTGVSTVVSALSGVSVAQANTNSGGVVITPVSNSITEAPAVDLVQGKSMSSINVWWPTDGSSMQGVQPFKAVVDGNDVSKYSMYWQVDGGDPHELPNSTTDSPHKESPVDISSWTWKGNGPYVVHFVAKAEDGSPFADRTVTIYNGGFSGTKGAQPQVAAQTNTAQTQTTAQSATTPVAQLAKKVLTTLVSTHSSSNPFSGMSFYLDQNNDAKKMADSVRSSNPDEATQLDKIGNTPTSVWLGDWNTDVGGYVKQVVAAANTQSALPTFVVYDIPGRDCGQYSAGGSSGADGYKGWINQIASALGNNSAAFVIEPDGVALTSCLSDSQLSERYSLVQYAVTTLKSKPNAHVYIDAGHPNWLSADDIASRLTKAGVEQADGFALNTSNFYSTQSNIDYGSQISGKIGGKHFVIDTGRNGVGPTSDNQWCNPAGRALGAKPTGNTGNSLVDAFLWLKGPGGSDGSCNGGPNAGVFWPDYAVSMAKLSAN